MLVERMRSYAMRHRAARVLWRLGENLDRHDTPRVASAMAFDAFLSVIPLIAIAGYLLQKLHQSGGAFIVSLLSGAPPQVVQLLDMEFLRLSDGGAAVFAPLSSMAFLWVSSAGVATAMGVFETIYGSELRAWYIRRAIAMACVIGGFLAITLTAGIGFFIANLSGSLGASVIGMTTPALILVFLVGAFFRIAIRRPRLPQRSVWPGAVVTVMLWAMASFLFSLYVSRLAQYATLYGNLATVAILMLWLWLLSMSLIVGGEVNAELERLRDPVSGPQSVRPPAATPSAATPTPLVIPVAPRVPTRASLAESESAPE